MKRHTSICATVILNNHNEHDNGIQSERNTIQNRKYRITENNISYTNDLLTNKNQLSKYNIKIMQNDIIKKHNIYTDLPV